MALSDVEFSDLVGAIYDAAIDASLWPNAMERIRARFGFANGALQVGKLPTGESVVQATANLSDHYVREMAKYSIEFVDLWGGAEAISRLPLEEPLLNSETVSPETMTTNRYYREWAVPQNLVDQVAIMLVRDRTTVATVGFGLNASSPRAGEETLSSLRLLAPHLRRAAIISRLIDAATGMAATFEAALAASGSAAILVRPDMTIVYANEAAGEMLRYADPVRQVDGRLELTKPLLPGNLESAVQATQNPETTLGRRGIGIPARYRDGSPVVAHVMPLRQRRIRTGAQASEVAAVFLADTGGQVALPLDALSMIYELTPTEAQVLELIAAGRSTQEIAAELSIAPSTLKFHLLNLYDKTGQHRQADLARLANGFTLPR